MRGCGVRQKRDILADIGLGKRLPQIVARRLAESQDEEGGPVNIVKPRPASSILIRGADGMAIQLADCCRPIPGDPIIGIIRKGQGLEIHQHDCPAIAKTRQDQRRWVDVDWEHDSQEWFFVTVRTVSQNVPGVLAKIATAIAENRSNIYNVTSEGEQAMYSAILFTIQVHDRVHLAKVMRSVRRVPEVVRIARLKGNRGQEEALPAS